MRLCVCGTSIEGRYPQCRFCGDTCRQRTSRQDRRRRRMGAAILRRPRCMVCDAPIRYGETGVRYDSTTCGRKRCVAAKRDWFGPRSRTERQDYSREWMRRKRAAA